MKASRKTIASMKVPGAAKPIEPVVCAATLGAVRGIAVKLGLVTPLSTVHTPRFEIGQAAARALLASLHSGQAAADARLPWTLVARGSS